MAGVPRVSTHSLRGLHSTLALQAGATSSAVAAALGHGSFDVTAKHYAAPGTVEQLQSKAVEKAIARTISDGIFAASSQVDPAELLREFNRLSPQLRAELRKALDEQP